MVRDMVVEVPLKNFWLRFAVYFTFKEHNRTMKQKIQI